MDRHISFIRCLTASALLLLLPAPILGGKQLPGVPDGAETSSTAFLPSAAPTAEERAPATRTGALQTAVEERAQDSPPDGATHHTFVEAVSLPIRRTEPVTLDAAKAVPTETAAATNTAPRGQPAQRDWRTLTFSSGAFTPQPGLDQRMVSGLPALRDTGRGFVYGFVSLNVFLTETIRDELAQLDVTLLGPHGTMHKVRLPADAAALADVVDLPHVEWVGFSTLQQKTSGALDVRMRNLDVGARNESADLQLVVNLFDDDPAGTFREVLEQTGAVVRNWDADLRAYLVTASPAEIEALIGLDFVLFVEPLLRERAFHDESMALIGADYIRGNGEGSRYDGSSVRLGIMDSGFAMGATSEPVHLDLDRRFGCGENTLTPEKGDWEEVWRDGTGHGTHVLGTITGTGAANPRYRGVAPGLGKSSSASIAAAKVFGDDGFSKDSSVTDGMEFLATGCSGGRPHVVNYSGGAAPDEGEAWNGTELTPRTLDAMVWEHQQTYVVAAGNEGPRSGSIGSAGAAKNALTVGNVLDQGYTEVGDLWMTSSIGVTADLRMKPNVVAPGRWVRSAKAGTRDEYVSKSGTSMAAPHVTGLVATLMDHYPQMKYEPALVRAILMATAILHDDDTTPAEAGVSPRRDKYGLGRVSSYVAHWSRSRPGGWTGSWLSGKASATTYGTRKVDVPSGSRRLVVVATWDEPPASAGAPAAVSYDYDLWIDRNGNCGRGNCGQWASQSREDNVEYLIIDNPPAGTYDVKLYPRNGLLGDGVPYGIAVNVIRGDPTPSMSLTATSSTPRPLLGQEFTITTTVSTPSYIASGVHLALTSPLSSSRHTDTTTTRKDGVTMRFPEVGTAATELTLGNVVVDSSRSATWKLVPTAAGRQTYRFRAWSENGGTKYVTLTVDVAAPGAPDLVVPSAQVSDAMLTPGQSFRFSATVRNQGNAASGEVVLFYYNRPTGGATRTLIGQDFSRALASGASSFESIDLMAPTEVGPYEYFACAANGGGGVREIHTANNCSRIVGVTVSAPDSAADRRVLEAFYDATGGVSWTDSTNWKTPAALRDWHGVTLDAATGRVATLVLQDNNLSGAIPGELGSLIGLTRLDLDGNNLSGRISGELGSLIGLTRLDLKDNNLSGPIPEEVGNLGNLTDLWLDGNNLSGPIPRELGRLDNLRDLALSRNNLSGPIPGELGSVVNLEWLLLFDNALSGPIPGELGNLINLEVVNLGDNRLDGAVPGELGGLINLRELRLYENELNGPLPSSMTNLRQLEVLWSYDNAGLCAPTDAAFQAWLATVDDFQGDACVGGGDNLAPQPVGTIPAQTLREGSGAIGVNVAAYFRDPDGDPLTYTAVSSNGGVATAAVSGSTVSLAPVLAGTATVTVTARDPGALTATQAIAVTVTSASDLTDRAVLGAFYDATDGPNWAISTNWKTEAALDDWYGVTARNGRVTELDLGLVYLLGPIPPELGNLGSLAYLDLSSNLFSGPIPPELGNLGSLAYLDLSFNGLSGPIPPELGNLTNLTDLWLGESGLSGPIPPELGNLTNLVNLYLHTNQLSGRIPPELGNLANLEVLYLYANPALTGPLPQSLTGLLRLGSLDISDSGLCAPADAAFQAWLANLNFQGDICADVANRAPQPVGTTPTYTLREGSGAIAVNVAPYFRDPDGDPLAYTAVTSDGRVVTAVVSGSTVSLAPVSAGTATVTVTARDPGGLSGTQTIAVTVTSSADAADRAVLEAFYDATGGAGWANSTNWKTLAPLGEWFGVTTDPNGRVTGLELGVNQLTGQIPRSVGNLTNLVYLGAWGNRLSGPIPVELGNLSSLDTLDLSGNQLSGPIPVELGNLTNLAHLGVGNNQLAGPIPPELWDLTNLVSLSLHNNQLSGPIPAERGNPSSLEFLDFSFNQLSGPIPAELGNLGNLTDLWLGYNRLSGPIPAELGNLTHLVNLYLYTNQLSGPVPRELGNLTNLGELYLNANPALTGPLPQSLTRLSRLWLLDISDSALCAPADATFQAWLAPLDFQGDTCAAPEPVGTFPAQTLREGGDVTAVDVSAYFQDPNGDPLTYTAMSSDNGIVTAAVSGSTVALTPASAGTATVTVTARDPAGLSATQTIAVTVFPSNRPPEPVGTLAPLTIEVDGAAVTVEVSGAFRDPDGDALTYGASSSAPSVAWVSVSGSRVTIAPVSAGTATVRVTATDVGGSNTTVTQTFRVTVTLPFTDDPIVPGVTPVKAAHFTELRARIDAVRIAVGLGRFPWTDSRVVAGVTPVKGVHMSELRTALAQAYYAAGRTTGFSTDAIRAGTGIRAWHINELRRAVETLER